MTERGGGGFLLVGFRQGGRQRRLCLGDVVVAERKEVAEVGLLENGIEVGR